MTKLSARERVRILLLCLVIAAAALFFCSKSSPAYPINDWSDANIYFSAGKGMLAGRVMYRDLYDHKGPLIYALHALCALACPADFTGVWVLEILLRRSFCWKAIGRFGRWRANGRPSFRCRRRRCARILAYCFQAGDSAEELALPMILLVQLHWLDALESWQTPPLSGGCLGTVFFSAACSG